MAIYSPQSIPASTSSIAVLKHKFEGVIAFLFFAIASSPKRQALLSGRSQKDALAGLNAAAL
jgi:hypothetical protein